MTDAILVLNAGSSSIKFAAFPAEGSDEALLSGGVERIGAQAQLSISTGERAGVAAPDHPSALTLVADRVAEHLHGGHIHAVCHRIVHGGAQFSTPIPLDDAALTALDDLIPLAPLHLPHGLQGVRAAQALYPDAAQIACFDTAFHSAKPWLHDSFALPQSYYDEGIRRYGFHGLSCESILRTLRAEGYPVDTRRIAIAHLGNGCSVTAVKHGVGHASSMGFSTLDGLVMGTRCGYLDPGVILYWLNQGKTAAEIEDILYHRSGLLGVSGLSNDMRDLTASTDPSAQRAVEVFVSRVVEEVCRLAGTMGGLDAVVFCGGIGENARDIRERITAGLGFLPGPSGAGPEILVRETREEHEIMLEARAVMSAASGP